MTARREQRTAKRQRAANRAAWRRSGKPPGLSKKKTTGETIKQAQEVSAARHHRVMVGQLLRGEMPTWGKPWDRDYAVQVAIVHAQWALQRWRKLGALAVKGCLNAQAAIALIAADAGIESPLEESYGQTD
jgi:hypothetical protein